MLATFITLSVLFALVAAFLGMQMLKKFGYLRDFARYSNQQMAYHHCPSAGQKAGMRNIVLRGEQAFAVLVGFEIEIFGKVGFDHYGFVCSNAQGVIVISTWMGNEGDFLFLVATATLMDNNITVTSNDDDQGLPPTATYPPHWYQKYLGL